MVTRSILKLPSLKGAGWGIEEDGELLPVRMKNDSAPKKVLGFACCPLTAQHRDAVCRKQGAPCIEV